MTWGGVMPRTAVVLVESLRTALRHPLATSSLVLIAAASTASVLITSGNSLATEAQVIDALDDEGSRVVVAFDADGTALVAPSSVTVLRRTAVAEWVVGFGPARDVDAGAAAAGPVAVRTAVGDLLEAVTLVIGRAPRSGEVVLGEDAANTAGIRDGVGTLSGEGFDLPVVGVFRAEGALEQLNDVGLEMRDEAEPADNVLRYLYALAPSIHDVATLARTMEVATVAAAPGQLRVEEPAAAVDVQQVISGQLGASARLAMALILVVSGVLVLTVVTMVVGSRRRDVGRWRALGATRSTVVASFLVQVGAPVLVGAVTGVFVGQAVNWYGQGFVNSWAFAFALVIDVVLVSLLTASIPATAASLRDPVRVLRVP